MTFAALEGILSFVVAALNLLTLMISIDILNVELARRRDMLLQDRLSGLSVRLVECLSSIPYMEVTSSRLCAPSTSASFEQSGNVGRGMFESVPKGDAIFIKILHDWSDERCLKLLKNCHNAILEVGKVIVVDAVLPIVPEISTSAKSTSQRDMIMMTQTLRAQVAEREVRKRSWNWPGQ
ncbi:cathecol O-methyltransferase 1-like [Prosopis cineraria]|uniref:cathecol O-methyltransferase 1-like n=1 Tax=Prosopis cineraria TaxID=364024 RepID=UPI00241073AC|nr:cathecol O-methyltransferase 1-like [Prosopis cineraria]